MGQLVFILGRSGTGKSYSMRNFPKDKFAVINVQGKILPFKGASQIETTPTDQSHQIIKALEIYAKDYKSIVIDDYQYTMANEFMRRSAERGYDKFTEIGRHAWDIANKVRELPDDVIVYVMCHTDRDDEGNEKIKTIGKLLDEKICLEGMSTIVLKTNVADGVYTFLTQNNGKDTVKSPAGMFPSYAIDNDLYYVDQKIRNYYELGEFLTDDDLKEIDEAVKHDDIPIKDEKRTRRSRNEKKNDSKEEQKQEETETAKEETEEKPKRSRRNNSATEFRNIGSADIDSGNVSTSEGNENTSATSLEPPKRSRRRKTEEPVETMDTITEEFAKAEANETKAEDLPKRKEREYETADKEPEQMEMPETAPTKRRRRRA